MAEEKNLPRRGESWYHVKLPKGMAKLDSAAGQTLLQTARVFSSSMETFVKQRHRTLCGPCSLAIIGNSLGLSAKILGHLRSKDKLDEDDVVGDSRVKPFAEKINLLKNGATLQEMGDIARKLDIAVKTFHVLLDFKDSKHENSNSLCTTVDEFRNAVLNEIENQSQIVLNYHMGALGYKDLGGHFSPVGAYSHTSDKFLILDTWPETPPAWVRSEDIFKAMATVDPSSQKSRGFLVFQAEL